VASDVIIVFDDSARVRLQPRQRALEKVTAFVSVTIRSYTKLFELPICWARHYLAVRSRGFLKVPVAEMPLFESAFGYVARLA
jgi:hypothetical protein